MGMAVPEARTTRITLDPRLLDLLRRRLPEVATHTIEAVTDEVPSYAGAFGGPMVDNVENAVQMALAGFLRIAARGRVGDQAQPLSPALEGAYALGRGEARSGRSADALLSAYRVGARVAWRELAETAVQAGVPADMLADFAELVFAYIDELSAASVAGHADELETSGRVRQGYLDRLAFGILRGDPADALVAAAERADWTPPKTLTAVILPSAQIRPVQGLLDLRTLASVGEPATLPDGLGVLLVPDAGGPVAGAADPDARRARRRRRTCPAVAVRQRVVRPGRAGARAARRGRDVRHRGAPRGSRPDRRPGGGRGPAGAGPGSPRRAPSRDPAEARGDAAHLAAAPGSARRRRGRLVRPPADGPLPHGPAARAVRRPAR